MISKLIPISTHFIDRLGALVSLLSLVMVLGTVITVLLRYGWGIGAIGLQESVLYCYAALWWLAAPMTLHLNGHVRVDIFYRNWSNTQKALIDCCGNCFLLLPVTLFLFWVSKDYVLTSWQLKESSSEPGGLPYVYYLKSLLLLAPLLLGLQSILLAIQHWQQFRAPATQQQ